MFAAAATKGDVTVRNVIPKHLESISAKLKEIGCEESLERLYNELLEKDWFMTFPDFQDYIKTKEEALAAYQDRKAWAKKMLVNISKAGFFSADRTIAQYNDEIWKLA